jgi:uncharacterized phage-associated protein
MFWADARLPDLTKWKICKLLFLADKIHLVRYGRPITGDTYYAVEWGPIPSDTLHALNNEHPLAAAIDKTFERVKKGKHPKYVLKSGQKVDWDSLSESDVAILKLVAEKYGHLSFDDLSNIVHLDRTYLKAWNARIGNRALMNFEDFFEAKSEIFEEVVENANLRAFLAD